jgi:transcriptional regulator with XRE-family HTH domain
VITNKEEIFGKILQEERKAKQISQEKLAKLTGLDRAFISLNENGKRNAIVNLANKHESVRRVGMLFTRADAIDRKWGHRAGGASS